MCMIIQLITDKPTVLEVEAAKCIQDKKIKILLGNNIFTFTLYKHIIIVTTLL